MTELAAGTEIETDAARSMPDQWQQTAIGAVIYDMDAELVALQARCSKTQALKQDMMHGLLTGRIRLV